MIQFQRKLKKLLNDEKYLDTILLEGSDKADKIASKKIKEIKELVGFLIKYIN